MTEITINLDQYNLLFENAAKYNMIVEAVKANIDKNEIYPVKEDEILLLTGLARYQDEHYQAMANQAADKIVKPEDKPEPKPEEEEDHAEDQTEL